MSCLYILEIKPLSVASFANNFSQSIGCLFVLFMVSFAKAYKFDYVPFVYFCFYFYCLGKTDPRKHRYDLCQRMFYLCSFLGVLWCLVLYLSL